jgi:hypothetical protein
MSRKFDSAIAVIGIDIGKNSFHVVGHDERGAIVLRQEPRHLFCDPSPRNGTGGVSIPELAWD